MLVITPCGGKKLPRPAEARDLYTGPYFRACLGYAGALVARGGGSVLILSAKHGLLGLDERVKPYDLRMGRRGCVTAERVAEQAAERKLLGEREVIALGGEDYVKVCERVWPGCSTPLRGIGDMFKQIRWLREHTPGPAR